MGGVLLNRKNADSSEESKSEIISRDGETIFINFKGYNITFLGSSKKVVFAFARQIVDDQISSEDEKNKLKKKINQMEEAHGTKHFYDHYKEFMAMASDHIRLIGAISQAFSALIPP